MPTVSKIQNGLTVATDTISHVESVTVFVAVSVGSRFEKPSLQGASHFLEHMAFKGTKKRTAAQIAQEVDSHGGIMNAFTGKEITAYYIKVLKEDAPLAFDILSDILLNSTFDEKELESERGVILQELANSLDTPDDIVFDYFFETTYPNQPIGHAILGTQQTITSLKSSDLKSYMADTYHAHNMVLSVSGNITHEASLKLAEEHFAGLPSNKDVPCQPSNYQEGVFTKHNDALNQVQFIQGFRGTSYNDEASYTLSVTSGILGDGMSSRLFQEIREKLGLVYTISTFSSSFSDSGIFGIYAGTSPENLAKLEEAILNELNRAANDGFTEDEIQKIRTQLKAGMLMGLESSSGRAQRIAQDILRHGQFITNDERLAKLSAVTAQDAQAQVQAMLTQKPTKTTYGKLPNHPQA